MNMNIKKLITPLLIIFLLLSIVVMGAPTYVNVGPTTEFDGDIKITDEIVCEGSIDDEFETTILITNPTADRTITIPDSDQTIGTATLLTVTDNENTNENNAILFTSGGALEGGNLSIECDGDLYYNPSTGTVTALSFSGDGSNLTGVGSASATALTISCKAIENINKGQVVYISGATGPLAEVGLADNTDIAKHLFCGVAAETKTTGQTILIRVSGELAGFDTTDFTEGDVLYLSTAGALTNVKPTSGTIEIIGYVSYDHATGSIIIIHHNPHGLYAPSTDDIVIRMGDSIAANKIYFKDYTNAEVGFVDSDGAADFTSLTLDNALIVAEGGTGQITEQLAINALTDVAGATNEHVLTKDTTTGNATFKAATGGGATQLSDLTDVGVTTPTDKYVLVADGDSWESRALVEADISDLGAYLEDITGESIFDLSDFPADPNADRYLMWDDAPVGELVWTAAAGYTNLTSFVDQTAWRLFYSNVDGDVTELAFGVDGTYLKSTGVTSAPIFDTPAGAGDMLEAIYDTDSDGDIDVAAGGTEKSAWTQYAIPYLSDTTVFGEIPIGTAGQVLKVSAGATGYEFATESDPTVDSDAELKAILVDEVTKTGDFTAGRMVIINNATGIIEQGTNTNADVADAVTKKHTQNTDTLLSIATALGSDHTYVGITDSKAVGENVVFGQLLYFDWAATEWKLAKANGAATAPALRIALETKGDGETCLMLVTGYIRDDSAYEFTAAIGYLSIATFGAVQYTVPSVAGNQVQRVGVGISADIMYFAPSIDVGEI